MGGMRYLSGGSGCKRIGMGNIQEAGTTGLVDRFKACKGEESSMAPWLLG